MFGVPSVRNAALSVVATNPLTTRVVFKTLVSNTAAVTDARVTMLQQPLVVENITPAEGDWLHYLMVSEDRSRVSDFKDLAKLTMPVLLIWGSTDTVTPLWRGRQLQKANSTGGALGAGQRGTYSVHRAREGVQRNSRPVFQTRQ